MLILYSSTECEQFCHFCSSMVKPLPFTSPAQLISELVQLLLRPSQLRFQVLPRGVELALQQLQLVCREGQPLPQVLLLLQQ